MAQSQLPRILEAAEHGVTGRLMPVASERVMLCALFLLACGCGSEDPGQAPPENIETPQTQLILVGGQSNAGHGGSDATRESRPLYANVKQFAGIAKAGVGWELQSENDFAALEPAYDDMMGGGQYIATMAGMAMGQDGGEYIVRTDWFGGQPISYFVDGTINFRNTLQAVRGAKALAGVQPLVCPWYVWIHGESGPRDRAIYAKELRSYIASIVPAIARETGQSVGPKFVILQTNTGDSVGDGISDSFYKPDDAVGLAQWDVAETTPGVILAGPTYQAPIILNAQDNIHLNSLGRMVVGDMLAAVKAAGPAWKPLQPIFARLYRNIILIRFHLPAGALAWDTTWIAPAPNYGFSFVDDERTAVISDVEIVSRDTVRIVLSKIPTGNNKTIRYAQGPSDLRLDGWSESRGQLISPTQRVSLSWSLGHPVPRTINHYAIKFELPLERAR